MQRRKLGSSGLKVSLVGLGCNNFGRAIDQDMSRKVVHKAFDLGINFFDTADIYGRGTSERILGEVLGERRHEAVVATKCGMVMDDAGLLIGGSRRHIMASAEASLKRLKTDYIDLYYMHATDPTTPIEESLRALDDLVHQGKVRYIACSNFPGWQVADAHWTSKHLNLNAFVASQDEYSLVHRKPEADLIPAIAARGMGLVPYFPLASGLLTGKYKRNAMPKGARLTENAYFANWHLSEANWNKVDGLEAFCKAQGHSLIELAFSWLAAQPTVASIIAGATSPEQLEQNAKSAGWALSAADLAEIDKLTK